MPSQPYYAYLAIDVPVGLFSMISILVFIGRAIRGLTASNQNGGAASKPVAKPTPAAPRASKAKTVRIVDTKEAETSNSHDQAKNSPPVHVEKNQAREDGKPVSSVSSKDANVPFPSATTGRTVRRRNNLQ